MKKVTKVFLLSLIIVTLTSCTKTQEDGILYKDFIPDLKIAWDSHDTIYLDFDNDGINDVRFYYSYWDQILMRIQEPLNGFDIRVIQEGETDIYPEDPYAWSHSGDFPWGWWNHYDDHFIERPMAVRKVVDNNVFYGWYRVYAIDSSYVTNNPYHQFEDRQWMYIDKMAFCTIPNCRISWGQTILKQGIDESNPQTFAIIHPNPSIDKVIITGENLNQAEVFNVLGQQVLSIKGEDNELRINMMERLIRTRW